MAKREREENENTVQIPGTSPKRAKSFLAAAETGIETGHAGLDETPQNGGGASKNAADAPSTVQGTDSIKELIVGITSFLRKDRPRFRGILKKRYTDFLVNEILPSGEVLHLNELEFRPEPIGNKEGQSFTDISDVTVNANGSDGIKDELGISRSSNQTKEVEQVQHEGPYEPQPDPSNLHSVSEEDRARLVTYFGENTVEQLLGLYDKIQSPSASERRDLVPVKTTFTSDRTIRAQIHQDIRRIFRSHIDSSTDNNGILSLFPSDSSAKKWKKGSGQSRGKDRRDLSVRKGRYVHFSLYKENKDTMEAVSTLSHMLHVNPKMMNFAGTKDRRAVSVQRISIPRHRSEADRLANLNKRLRGIALGDFQYHEHGLELGDLRGNEFVVTLRDSSVDGLESTPVEDAVEHARAVVEAGLTDLRTHGFFNYYGLQRFGTFATRTDIVGVKLLQGDFKSACDSILSYSPEALRSSEDVQLAEKIGSDDRLRARAIHAYTTEADLRTVLNEMPKKFYTEKAIIQHLSQNPNDYYGALMKVQRNMRLMYVHAYQSKIWNLAVTERWRRFGDQVMEGDLVLVNEHKDKFSTQPALAASRSDGTVETSTRTGSNGEDELSSQEDAEEDIYERARPLTATEAASGQYTIFDIVLPLPGYDVLYPQNEMETWYKEYMSSAEGGGLDPHDMRRKHRDFSLSGGYRKILARIGEHFSVRVQTYTDEDEQFVQTDLERIKSRTDSAGRDLLTAQNRQQRGNEADPDKEQTKIAVILKFQLGTSQYATVALRELSKGGIVNYQPDFFAR